MCNSNTPVKLNHRTLMPSYLLIIILTIFKISSGVLRQFSLITVDFAADSTNKVKHT